MKLIALQNSPYWGANLHVGFYPDGSKKYKRTSSKVVRDPSRVNERGQRLDKEEATRVLTALQNVANEAMADEGGLVTRQRFEAMVDAVLRACGKKVAQAAPSWDSFATEFLTRHCRDLSPATVRSYWAKKSGFDKWLEGHAKLSPKSSLAEFRLADIQEFYDYWIEAGGQSTTANGVLQGVSLVFEQAVIADYITKNPCVGVRRRDNVMVPRQPFTLADLAAISRALVEHADSIEFADEWALAIRFAIFTGAREGDCVRLRWSDFSEGFRRVRFVPGKKERLHRLGKIDASVSLLIPPFVAAEFQAAKERSESEYVTPSLLGVTAGRRGLGARFREILDLAGVRYEIREAKGRKGIAQCSHTFHSFRHTLKTQLRAAGVAAETSNYVTGHDDAKVAARYVHEKAETVFRECAPVFEEFHRAIG